MAVRMLTAAALLTLCLSSGAQAKRSVLQFPTYTNSGINVEGANGAMQQAGSDPATDASNTQQQQAAQTATPTLPAAPAQAPLTSGVSGASPPVSSPPVSSPPTPVILPPAQAPVQPPTQPPTQPPMTPPTQAPVAPPTQPPALQPPVPAPAVPVLPQVQAPVPAPSTPPQPAAQAPAPVPPAPIPAPAYVLPLPLTQAPAPVPAPVPAPQQAPPQCGQQPQCRLFVEDMLCCENAGVLTNKQHAVMRLQCTHPVNYYPKCFNVTGPTNTTSFNQFETDVWSSTHVSQLNILGGYTGNVTVDIEKSRTGNMSADCGLFITPCMYNGNLVSTVAPVSGISFSTIPTEDFIEVAESVQVDLDDLDSIVFPNMYYPQACQQQNVGALNSTFYSQNWVNYTAGNTYQCNYTAFVDALAPAPANAAVAMPVNSVAVSG